MELQDKYCLALAIFVVCLNMFFYKISNSSMLIFIFLLFCVIYKLGKIRFPLILKKECQTNKRNSYIVMCAFACTVQAGKEPTSVMYCDQDICCSGQVPFKQPGTSCLREVDILRSLQWNHSLRIAEHSIIAIVDSWALQWPL